MPFFFNQSTMLVSTMTFFLYLCLSQNQEPDSEKNHPAKSNLKLEFVSNLRFFFCSQSLLNCRLIKEILNQENPQLI